MVKAILQLEGAVVFAASIWAYFGWAGGHWLLLALLLLAPDVSMIGFLKDSRLGAAAYNLAHNYILAAALMAAGVALDNSLAVALGLILSAHVGMDRMLAFGLKYATGFKDTHMQRV